MNSLYGDLRSQKLLYYKFVANLVRVRIGQVTCQMPAKQLVKPAVMERFLHRTKSPAAIAPPDKLLLLAPHHAQPAVQVAILPYYMGVCVLRSNIEILVPSRFCRGCRLQSPALPLHSLIPHFPHTTILPPHISQIPPPHILVKRVMQLHQRHHVTCPTVAKRLKFREFCVLSLGL